MHFNTLTDEILDLNKNKNIGITFISSETVEEFVSYHELEKLSLNLLYVLQKIQIKPGDELVFQLSDNKEFLVTFWACVLGGIKAVPATPAHNNDQKLKFFNIWKTLTKPFLITDIKTYNELTKYMSSNNFELNNFTEDRIIIFNNVTSDKHGKIYNSKPVDIVLIQFSSGSTGDPKGVILTHENLIINTAAITKQAKMTHKDSMLSWLPLTHDMGLILAHLTACYAGISQYWIPTSVFIQNPILWLEKTNQHRNSILYSSNFGFFYFLLYFTNRINNWDLSCIRLMYNGGEPVSYKTCIDFLEALEPYGLKKTSMIPAYGMAEATVDITFTKNTEEVIPHFLDRDNLNIGDKIISKKNSAAFVDLGHVIDNCSIRISNEMDIDLGENTIGHIQIKGKNITQGYYNNPEATEKAFTKDRWFRTGDVGFIKNNRLTITGRAKDIIIINGKNYYPEDIERTAAALEELDIGKIAVMGLYNSLKHKEEIILFIRHSTKKLEEFYELSYKAREKINQDTGILIENILPVRRIPKTTSGKVQRYKLKQDYISGKYDKILLNLKQIKNKKDPGNNESIIKIKQYKNKNDLLFFIKNKTEEILGNKINDYDLGFNDLGLDSIKIIQVKEKLESIFNIKIPVSFSIDFPTLNKITDAIADLIFNSEKNNKIQSEISNNKIEKNNDNSIAIIGMACIFPGDSTTPDKFWNNLINHRDLSSGIPYSRWNKNGKGDNDNNKLKIKKGYFLHDIDKFGADFFNISPVQAVDIDPQQRILLETSWKALENACINAQTLIDSDTGVFIGVSDDEYTKLIKNESADITGSILSTASGRISYFYGLQGPSMSIDTACSSSLTAIHNACNSLLNNECSLAIAGGINIIAGQENYLRLQQYNALSNDGKCKSFDNEADGYARGEGCGLLILKKLTDAEHNNDNILGIIKGTAVNHDGKSSGITVPNGMAQEKVILNALKKAKLNPEDIDYIEAHGTGTKIGDPQEINALNNVFGKKRNKRLMIGSVKSNIGHLEPCAGVAGIIKVILCMQNFQIPGQLHLNKPNTFIEWNNILIKIVDKNIEWNKNDKPVRAGISSFGMSGTNVHVILEKYKSFPKANKYNKKKYNILVFTAKTDEELRNLAYEYKIYIENTKNKIEDICFSSMLSRTSLKKRVLFTGNSKNDFTDSIDLFLKEIKTIDEIKTSSNKLFQEKEKDKTKVLAVETFLNGGILDYRLFYEPHIYKKVLLPNYPFKKKSFWPFDIENKISVTDEINQLIYNIKWFIKEKEDLKKKSINKDAIFCIFANESKTASILENEIYNQNGKSIIIKNENMLNKLSTEKTLLSNKKIYFIYMYTLDFEFNENCTSKNIKQNLKYLYEKLLLLIRTLNDTYSTENYKLWIITKNYFNPQTNSIPNLLISTLWGFCSSLEHELDKNWGGIIDIDNYSENNNIIKTIISEIIKNKESKIAFNNNKMYTPHLTANKKIHINKNITIDKKSSYIITGGFGKIGFRLVQWISNNGAEKIFITGRSELTHKKKNLLNTLNNSDCSIEYIRCDVSDNQEVEKSLNYILKKECKIKGIIHAAGISNITLAYEHDINSLWEVLAPKVSGTWNLYNALKNIELDFFLVLSSMASYSGGMGISAYSAANEFLNSFAVFCNSKNFPVTSINLGLWGEGGMSKGAFFDHLTKIGHLPIESNEGINAIEKLICSDLNSPSIIKVDWEKYTEFLTDKQKNGIFKLVKKESQKYENNDKKNTYSLGHNSSHTSIIKFLSEQLTKTLDFNSIEEIDNETPFLEIGMDSILIMKYINQLNKELNTDLSPSIMYSYVNIKELAKYLIDNKLFEKSDLLNKNNKTSNIIKPHSESTVSTNDIAIIGMECRFPGASNTQEFWNNMYNSVDSITKIPADRWDNDLYYDPDPDSYGKIITDSGGFIKNISNFDADFFNISPVEAIEMDPQQRLLLEVSWHAFENAGMNFNALKKTKTGVFIGISNSEYSQSALMNKPIEDIQTHFLTGSALNSAASKISYFYDLTGPALAIDTACSSSLVSIHMAVKSLLNHESDIALAGGVNVIASPVSYIALSRIGALAPDGKCKTFDNSADGYGRAEGCGLIVLKRISDAEENGDRILGVIKGSAINHSGKSIGKTAPNGLAQENVIKQALVDSKLNTDDIDYVEVHGTGTILGDPIEIEALGNVFKNRKDKLLIGTVKTNIGHAESASGISGVIKVILSLQHKLIPPNLHFKKPNHHIKWYDLPFNIVTSLTSWEEKNEKKRHAGVSSFGLSGTNVHVIIEEYENSNINNSTSASPPYILTLSAKTNNVLNEVVKNIIHFIKNTDESISDICYTSNISRTSLNKKIAFTGKNKKEIVDQIENYLINKNNENNFLNEIKKIIDMDGEIIFETPFNKFEPNILYPDGSLKKLKNEIPYQDEEFLAILVLLYSENVKINWSQYIKYNKSNKIVLPCYPFDTKSYWNPVNKLKISKKKHLYSHLNYKKNIKTDNNLKYQIEKDLNQLIKNIAGVSPEVINKNKDKNFFALGFDSLYMTLLRQYINKKYKLNISFNKMQDELNNYNNLLEYLYNKLNNFNQSQKKDSTGKNQNIETNKISNDKKVSKYLSNKNNNQILFTNVFNKQLEILQKTNDNSIIEKIIFEQLNIMKNITLPGKESNDLKKYLNIKSKKTKNNKKDLRFNSKKNEETEILIEVNKIIEFINKEYINLYQKHKINELEKSDELLNKAGVYFIKSFFKNIGMEIDNLKKLTGEEIINNFNIIPPYDKLYFRTLEILEHYNVLINSSTSYKLTDNSSIKSLKEIQVIFEKQYPEIKILFDFLNKCGNQLLDIMQGKIDYVSIFFSDNGEKLKQFYIKEPFLNLVHNVLANSINYILNECNTDKKIKIIELGSGTGSASKMIISKLTGKKIIYYFTDISNFFLINAKQEFNQYNFITYEKVDLMNDSDIERMKEVQFDVVIASNVIHAASNIEKALENTKKILNPGGLLLMVEISNEPGWLDLIFGLTKEWWGFKDKKLRSTTPLLTQIQWKSLLNKTGFTNYTTIPEKNNKKTSRPFITIAQKPKNKTVQLLPMSSVQKRLYSICQNEQADSNYHITIQFEIIGNFLKKRFENSIRTILNRHDIFKTAFELKNSNLIQKIYKENLILKINYINASEEEVESIRNNMKKSYDFKIPPLFRIAIIENRENKHIIIFDFHHIIIDSYSLYLFMDEMIKLYNNPESQFNERFKYTDYIKYEKNYFKSKQYRIDKKYWKNKFNQMIEPLQLPYDYQRSSKQTFSGNLENLFIPLKELNNLKQFTVKNKITLNILLTAVTYILLYKLSNNKTITLGSLVSGRNNFKFESTIGMFVNTVVFKSNIDDEYSLNSFLKSIKKDIMQSYRHQDFPYEKLVKNIVKIRDNSRNPVFDVMFAFENNSSISRHFILKNGGEIKNFTIDLGNAQFDMQIQANEYSNGISIDFKYNTNLFKKETIKRWTGYYRFILDCFLKDTNTLIKHINLVTEIEKQKIFTKFNSTEAYFPENKTIHQFFEEQVIKTPDNIALIYSDRILKSSVMENRKIKLTYKELNDKANKIAYILLEKGVTTESIIGIMTERSIEMISGILGILKSGGAYLPINPHYPKDRINFILKDCNTGYLLTHKDFTGSIDYTGTIIYLDDPDLFNNIYAENPEISVKPENLAYIIYTSGSTGKPKGAMIEHKSVVNRLIWMQKYYPLSEKDTILQKTPFTFDVSVWELFWWTFTGAKLSILEPGSEKDPALIVNEISQSNVTVIHFVPSMLALFLDYIETFNMESKIKSLKHVFASGEALSVHYANQFNSLLYKTNSTKLTNLYGPTEATVDVSYFYCTGDKELNMVPIGKPIDNIKLYVVNEYLELQPLGVPGELCISGTGLARGYLNRADLTDEKFIINPFDKNPEYNRLYKTGDIVRLLPDGNILYIGRKDNQVKIRGNRIELKEIENILLKNPGIKECIVNIIEIDNEKCLCAYYTSDNLIKSMELNKFIIKQLPEYMVPSYFQKINEIPLNANGKADRKALPLPDINLLSNKEEYIAPVTEQGKKIISCWKKIFKIDRVSMNDNFFTLGGDSIKAVRIINLLNIELSYGFKVQDIYKYQTPMDIVQLINSVKNNPESNNDPEKITQSFSKLKNKISKSGIIKNIENIEDIYPMSSIEKGMVFHSLKEEGKSVYHDQHVHTLYYENFNPDLYKKAFALLIDKHEILRTDFNMKDFEQPVQIVYKRIDYIIEDYDLIEKTHEEQEKHIKKFLNHRRNQPFSIDKAPLWRLAIFKINKYQICLTWEFHHAILDGWSNISVITELHEIYEKLIMDINYIPEKLSSSYKNYVVEESGNLISEEAVNFWKQEMSDSIRLDFNTIFRSGDTEKNRELYFYDLGTPLLKKVVKVSQKYNIDVKSICFAAYLFTMSMMSYENDITVGLVTHTRPVCIDGDRILGCFLNTIPVRFLIRKSMTWENFITELNNKLMDLKKYEKIPLFQIARYIKTVYDKNPFFDTLFNFFNFHKAKTLASNYSTDISVQGYEHTNTILDFNLNLTLDRFVIYLNYSANIINKDNIHNICCYYEKILNEMINFPHKNIDKKDILSNRQKDLIIKTYNDTCINLNTCSISELIDKTFSHTPDCTALIADSIFIHGKSSYTYNDLHMRVNALCKILIEKGAVPGVFVGIALPRTLEMIVSMLAVLRTGTAYVPLDITYPAKRLEFMIQDSKTKIVITTGDISHQIPGNISRINFDKLDTDYYKNTDLSLSKSYSYPEPESLAYMIYTSGSTGTPKGVMITHENIHNFIIGMNEKIKFSVEEPILSVTTISFDIFVLESLLPLVLGIPIILANEEEQKDPFMLNSLIDKYNIKILQTTPSRLKTIFENINNSKLTGILAGGETFTQDLFKLLKQKTNAKIYNVYGPTETTVWSTVKNVTDDETITIGKPIANTQIYILDKSGQILPPGIFGHLCIGGKGVAAGYFNRPVINAKTFIDNPFIPGEKLYKTGDMARWLKNGNLDFYGRIDRQIKIRGHRIEPGEIEHQILSNNYVKECAIIIYENNYNKSLCAYYTLDELNKSLNLENKNDNTTEALDKWQEIWDNFYSKSNNESTFNTIGWISSFTGKEIPEKEMKEWLNLTVERIINTNPENILEIGCGTGMLLFSLIDKCKSYTGTDISGESINYISKMLKNKTESQKIQLFNKPAHDFNGIKKDTYDCIIINSVIQYFPDAEYLVNVISNAIDHLLDKGCIFIGDVRNYDLMKAFHTQAVLSQSQGDVSVNEIKKRINKNYKYEKELLLSPEFFYSLQKNITEISHVEIRHKKNNYQNEMNIFRYDVLLYKNVEPVQDIDKEYNWQEHKLNLDNLESFILKNNQDYCIIKSIPDKRLFKILKQTDLIEKTDSDKTINSLLHNLAVKDDFLISPAKICSLKLNKYSIEPVWSSADKKGYFSIIIYKNDQFILPAYNQNINYKKNWINIYTNTIQKKENEISNILKNYLKSKLPDFMIPDFFIKLEHMPMTPNGKINKNALPLPIYQDQNIDKDELPETEIEIKLEGIYKKILETGNAIGINTNFFDIGGHSLNAINLVSRIKKEFLIEIPLSFVFNYPKIRHLSNFINNEINKNKLPQIKNYDIKPVEKQEYYELSKAQKRIYTLHKLENNSTAYNLPCTVEIRGKLDLEKFHNAFKEFVHRHESMRTVFKIINGNPVQIILSDCDFSLEYIKIEDSAKINRILKENIKPFELSKLPLFRTIIFELSYEHYIFFMDIHHIITDGKSFEIMINELLSLYDNKKMPPVKIQYKDFSDWQNKIFKSGKISGQKDFWLNKLYGEIPVLELPVDFTRPKVQSFKGSKLNFTIDKETVISIRNLSLKYNVSVYMILLSFYNILLSKYSNSEDIVTGSPSAGRNHHQLDNCTGMFVNSLVMRNQPGADKTFIDFLLEVRKNAIEVYENQDYQFDELVEQLNITRDLSRNPVFNTMFALQTIGKKHFESDSLILIPYDWDTGISLFDISLSCWEMESTIEACFEYCTDLFKTETIAGMIKHFKTLIKNILKNPETKIKEIKMISQQEENDLLLINNKSYSEFKFSRTIIDAIEEQVLKTPGNIAVTGPSLDPDQNEFINLTYEELYAKAINFSALLQKKGIGKNTIVGIITQKSIEMIICIIAVLKAGAAYLPIDPEYPAGRIQYIIDDSKIRILLSGNIDIIKSGSFNIDRVIDISTLNSSLITDQSVMPFVPDSPGDTAYVIYTSGSSGKPKGVMISHENLACYVSAFLNEFDLTQKDVVLQQASYSFDTFVEEVFPILTRGGRIVVLEKYNVLDINKLLGCINKYGITFISCSPQLLHILNKSPISQSVHTYVSGGDVLKWEYFNNLIKNAVVYNTYGPTETTVCAAYYKCDNIPLQNIPIGKPIAGYKLFVMDRQGNPVSKGIPGELWISSAGTAAGYHGNPELTCEKFIKRSFSENIIYKTGDMVRWNNDGNLEYIGRIDTQVKIRGYRIEPGEIENVLIKYPGIDDVLIHVINNNNDKFISAYYTLKPGIIPITHKELRKFLLTGLPEYMVPSYFIHLDKIPITAHGKINKQALPLPDHTIFTGNEYREPEGEIEIKITGIWKTVLNLDKISTNDDFFSLGGNSLKAVSVISAIDSEFNIEFPLIYFFKFPTIKAMSNYILNSASEYADYLSDKPLLLNKENKNKIFCFPPLAAYSIYYKQLADELDNYAVYSFGFIKAEDRIKQYADNIIETDPDGPYIFMGYCSGGNLAFEAAKEMEKRNKCVSDIIMFDSTKRTEKRFVYPYMVNDFLNEIKKIIESLPGSINESTKEELIERSKIYYFYFQELVNTGSVNSKIHQVMSEQDMHNNYGWDIATGNEYKIYQGKGIHFLMLSQGNMKINSKIVKNKILINV